MSVYASNTPLNEVLTWKSNDCVVVCDSFIADGRFVLVQDISLRSRPVLWLSCGPTSEALVLNSLKKIGHDFSNCKIRAVSSEIGKHIENGENFEPESFVKLLYRDVDEWTKKSESCCVVVDDMSTLATLVGERLTYAFIASLKALSVCSNVGLLLRVALDADHREVTQPKNTRWIGAGGSNASDPIIETPLERSIVELADVIVDVLPLASGYTREAHGRLIISRADCETQNQHEVFNYCLHDTKATAIRLKR